MKPPLALGGAWLALAFLLVGLGRVRGDVVHLKNGAKLRGRIVQERGDTLLLKTPTGRISLKRSQIKRIERESRAKLWLEQARRAEAAGDRGLARKLYRKVLKGEDAAFARRAKAALAKLDAQGSKQTSGRERAPDFARWRGGDPVAAVREEQAYFRQLEQVAEEAKARGEQASAAAGNNLALELYRRAAKRSKRGEHLKAASDLARACKWTHSAEGRALMRRHEARARLSAAGQAIRKRQGGLALGLVEPILAFKGLLGSFRVRAQYLLGRACELSNRRPRALKTFKALLGKASLAPGLKLAALRELARAVARGKQLTRYSPGVGEEWRWVESRHFAILHQGQPRPGLSREFEAHRVAVYRRLRLTPPASSNFGRVVLFVFKDAEAYQKGSNTFRWAGGHAQRFRDDDEVTRQISVYPWRRGWDEVVRHELTHIVVGDLQLKGRLPNWANEGVAIYCQPDRGRARLLAARAYAQRKELQPAAEFLGFMLYPRGGAQAITRFYSQAALTFLALARRLGPLKALQLALKIDREGPKKALSSVRLSLRSFELLLQQELGRLRSP